MPFGSVTIVAGASGAGKTIFMAEVMARIRAGRTVCGHATNSATGYYVVAADRDWSTYAKAFGYAGFPDVQRYVLAEDPDFDPRSWGRKSSAFTLFEDCITKLSPVPGSLVYIDPVAPLFIQGNQNDARDVALSLHWYRRIARSRQITLILFANVGKQKAEDVYRRAQDRIAGSGAFVAYSDTQISIDQDEQKVMTMRWVPRSGGFEEYQFVFDEKHTHLFIPKADSTPVKEGVTLPPHLARLYELLPQVGMFQHLFVKLAMEKLSLKKTVIYSHLKALFKAGVLAYDDEGKIQRRKPH